MVLRPRCLKLNEKRQGYMRPSDIVCTWIIGGTCVHLGVEVSQVALALAHGAVLLTVLVFRGEHIHRLTSVVHAHTRGPSVTTRLAGRVRPITLVLEVVTCGGIISIMQNDFKLCILSDLFDLALTFTH